MNKSFVRKCAIAPLVLGTRLLIKLTPNHPYHNYDMTINGWNRNGTELFRLYAYVFDVMIVAALIALALVVKRHFM